MDITIEKLIYGGDGLAHHEGSTVFVPFVLPAERAAAPVEQKKKFIRARLERLIDQSAGRVVPRCPHFGVCGGCNYQHIAYEAQLQYKTEILRETLRRLGRIEWPGEIAFTLGRRGAIAIAPSGKFVRSSQPARIQLIPPFPANRKRRAFASDTLAQTPPLFVPLTSARFSPRCS